MSTFMYLLVNVLHFTQRSLWQTIFGNLRIKVKAQLKRYKNSQLANNTAARNIHRHDKTRIENLSRFIQAESRFSKRFPLNFLQYLDDHKTSTDVIITIIRYFFLKTSLFLSNPKLHFQSDPVMHFAVE